MNPSPPDLEALARAHRLSELGFEVRSPSLLEQAKTVNEFNARGGNRRMRRAAARARRRKGSR
jgi:hypothetical protein